MTTVETGIRDAMLSVIEITGLVATRIRPLAMGQDDQLPYCTYHVTDRKTESTLDGEVDDYRTVEFEIGIYAESFDDVKDLSELIRNRLDQLGETVSGIEFAPCQLASETDVEQVLSDGIELPVYLRVQTYTALYRIVG